MGLVLLMMMGDDKPGNESEDDNPGNEDGKDKQEDEEACKIKKKVKAVKPVKDGGGARTRPSWSREGNLVNMPVKCRSRWRKRTGCGLIFSKTVGKG